MRELTGVRRDIVKDLRGKGLLVGMEIEHEGGRWALGCFG